MSVKARLAGGFVAIMALVVFGQATDTSKSSWQSNTAAGSARGEMPVTEDIAKKVINAVNINPVALIWGNINVSYERFFPDKHGAMLQLGYFLKNGISVAAHYRYHYYKEDQTVLNSPYIGAFVSFTNTKDEANIEVNDNSINVVPTTVSYLNIGVNWGRRWILSNAMDIACRIGYGFPIVANFEWPTPPPGGAKSIENKKKYWNGIDAELSLGYTF
jgi:hypothetical protein